MKGETEGHEVQAPLEHVLHAPVDFFLNNKLKMYFIANPKTISITIFSIMAIISLKPI